jgi:hypothetical protein
MNQVVLQGCGSFWRSLFASQHGMHCLDVGVGDLLVFLASDVRRTRNEACPEGLTQNAKPGICFKYLRQAVEFR